MIKRLFLSISLLILATTAVFAASQSPEEALRGTVEHLQSLIEKNHEKYKSDPQAFYKVVNEVAVPRFDVPYIARLVLARYWRTASDQQRKAFQSAFKEMLIRSYANALLDNTDSSKVVWKPSRVDSGSNEATVHTELVKDDGTKYPISFSVHKVDGDWKIYDITVNNISLALNFRSQITADVKRSGLDAVIKRMQHTQMQGPVAKPKGS